MRTSGRPQRYQPRQQSWRPAPARRSPPWGALLVPIAALALIAFAWTRVEAQRPSAPGATLPAAVRQIATPPPPPPPELRFDPPPGGRQTARALDVGFTSSAPLSGVDLKLEPTPAVRCEPQLAAPTAGTLRCDGLLAGSTEYKATLGVASAAGRTEHAYAFRTMENRLEGVPWYTEFENPRADPLACAAASVRIVQHFNTGVDKMTAEQILRTGQQFNKSRDPGLDPAAIATVLRQLDARNTYHYYVFADREQATKAIAYWLLRSGRPVIAITLAGQHAPVVTGFTGQFGASFSDPANRVDGLVVLDPQRGDLNPLTQNRRADKYRTVEFQTGRLLDMREWYGDEWWFAFSYAASIRVPNGSFVNIERNDGAYPTPHWAGKFVILVDDGDAEWPPDREGRQALR